MDSKNTANSSCANKSYPSLHDSSVSDLLLTSILSISLQSAEISALIPKYYGKPDEDILNWVFRIENIQKRFNICNKRLLPLVVAKLKKDALHWYKLNITPEDSFDEFKSKMTDHYLRQNFSHRKWSKCELFEDYFEDKVLMGKELKLSNEDLIQSVIDGMQRKKLQKEISECKFQSLDELKSKMFNIGVKQLDNEETLVSSKNLTLDTNVLDVIDVEVKSSKKVIYIYN